MLGRQKKYVYFIAIYCMTSISLWGGEPSTFTTAENTDPTVEALVTEGAALAKSDRLPEAEEKYKTDPSFDTGIRLLSARYKMFMNARAKEREPAKWGGREKVVGEVNALRRPLLRLSRQLQDVYPDKIPKWAELNGDLEFWAASGYSAAAQSYYLALHDNLILSDRETVLKKLSQCLSVMVDNSNIRQPNGGVPAGVFLKRDQRSPVSAHDVAIWRAGSASLANDPKLLFQATEGPLFELRELLSPSPSTTRPGTPVVDLRTQNDIITSLGSSENERVTATVKVLRKALQDDADSLHQIATIHAGFWYGTLMHKQRYQDVADLAQDGVVANSANPDLMSTLFCQRVDALLEMRHPEAALAAAKSAYNLSPVDASEHSISQVHRAMVAAGVSEKDIQEFSRDQRRNQKEVANKALSRPLNKVQIDADQFKEALARLSDRNDFISQMKTANLLLATGKLSDAGSILSTAASRATDPEQRQMIVSGIARVAHAVDGSPQRAIVFQDALKSRINDSTFSVHVGDIWSTIKKELN